VLEPDHWIFEGLDESSKQLFGMYADGEDLKTVVGNETDKQQPFDSDPCTPSSPLSFLPLAEVPQVDDEGRPTGRVACTMGIFSSGKGQVFTAATLNWSLGLSQSDQGWNAIDQITRNVFDRLG
jgi:hypothetical protein